jgi:hypothetical protein
LDGGNRVVSVRTPIAIQNLLEWKEQQRFYSTTVLARIQPIPQSQLTGMKNLVPVTTTLLLTKDLELRNDSYTEPQYCCSYFINNTL